MAAPAVPPQPPATGTTEALAAAPGVAIAWPGDKVLVMLDAEGRVLLWNQAAERFFGKPSEGVIGRALGQVLEPELAQRLSEAAEQALRDRVPLAVGEVRSRAGLVTRHLEMRCTTIGAGPRIQVLLVGHDVTAERNPHVAAGLPRAAARPVPRAARERAEVPAAPRPEGGERGPGEAPPGTSARGHLDFLGDGLVVCDEQARVLFWSQATAARFGVRPEDAVGRRLFDVLPLADTRGAREAARLALLGITSAVDDAPALAEGGVRLTVAPAGDLGAGTRGFVVVSSPGGKDGRPDAASPEERFAALYAGAAEPVLLVLPSGEVRAANPAARRALPVGRGRGPGKARLRDLLVPGARAEGLANAGLREAAVVEEVRVRTRRGPRAWTVLLWPVTRGPAPLRVAMFRDTTEQRRREAAVRRSADALTVYNRILLHDVSNLATAIAGHLELGREAAIAPDTRRHLAAAQGLLSEMEALLRNVSILNQAPGRRREVVDAWAALDQAVAVTALAFPGRPPPRVWGPRSPAPVRADATLTQVFYNVLSNAVRHNPRPDPLVVVRARAERRASEPWMVWTVEDNGPGLHPSLREAPPLDRVRGRAGLGLSLSTTLVRRWGGWLRVEDRVPGKPHLGTAVRIGLPLSRAPPPSRRDGSRRDGSAARVTARSRRPRTRRGRSGRGRA